MKEQVQEVVNDLYLQHGYVKPTDLIKAAKSKDSPAHDAFEWDNKKAGHEYRLMQARQWIRKVVIIVENTPERFIHIPTITAESAEGYYKPLSVLVEDVDEYQLAFYAVVKQLSSAKESYNELKNAVDKRGPETPKPNFKRADRGFELVETALQG